MSAINYFINMQHLACSTNNVWKIYEKKLQFHLYKFVTFLLSLALFSPSGNFVVYDQGR
uniref:Uncharacterized protein n=1 Tax=Arion vulgaris TaxID=1028688 RepID=A0A0B7AV91_9EUPU